MPHIGLQRNYIGLHNALHPSKFKLHRTKFLFIPSSYSSTMRTPLFVAASVLFVWSCQANQTPQTVSAADEVATTDSIQPSALAENERNTNITDTLVIALTGDIMMGTTFPRTQLPPNGGSEVFRDTREITRRADIALGNLEGTLVNGGKSTKGNGPNSFAFRTPPSYGQWLADAGYDYVSQANNHANDFGMQGILSTEQVLDSLDIAYGGISGRRESVVVERNGVRYGICAFGHNRYTYKHTDLALVGRVLKELRDKCDILIVSFHGGAEGKDKRHLPQGREIFLGEDRGSLREFAHFCIDHGADVVFGHGPHVVRAMEVYKDKFVAYSLGNFCTPYGMSLSGISGYSPVCEIRIDGQGKFLDGQIHSFIQQRGHGPRIDHTHAVAREIRLLSQEDFPASPLRIDETGAMRVQE